MGPAVLPDPNEELPLDPRGRGEISPMDMTRQVLLAHHQAQIEEDQAADAEASRIWDHLQSRGILGDNNHVEEETNS